MITFKPLEISKIETIISLMHDFYSIDNYPFDIDVSKQLMIEFIFNENLGKAWLIHQDAMVIGYVILTFIFSFEYQGRIAFIDELYVIENFRGKGIGKQTIDFIKNEATLLNVKLLYLEVEHHNENAQKLYLANDFDVHNRKLLICKL